jgi:hypothetical protein
MKRSWYSRYLCLAALLGLSILPAATAQISSNISGVALSITSPESLSIQTSASSLAFAYTAGVATIPAQTFNLVTTWNAANTRSTLAVAWWLAAPVGALTGPAGNGINASQVSSQLNGGALAPCVANAVALVPNSVAGATCAQNIALALSAANDTGTRTDAIGVGFNGLSLNLPAGTYSGVLSIQATLN